MDDNLMLEVVTTVGEKGEATKLAESAVVSSMAACAQIDGPVTSVYRWDGKVQSAVEYRVTFKVALRKKLPFVEWLTEQHSYELPQIVVRTVVGSAAYRAWVESNSAP